MPKTSARLLALLSLLQSRRDWPGGLLAERLGISLRTIRRDVDRLRELGYPIAATKGPDGGYRLSAGKELPPLLFDDEQAVAVVLALQVAGGEAAERALATIRQVLPSRLRHRVNALRVTAVGRPATNPPPPVDGGLLLALTAAVHAGEVLRFDYTGGGREEGRGGEGGGSEEGGRGGRGGRGGEGGGRVDQAGGSGTPPPPRRVEPHHVVTWDGRWYLVAWDLERGDWRTFRVDRIALRTPNGPRFAPRELPGGDVAAYVTGVFRGSVDTSGNWPCRGTVTLGKPASTIARYTRDGIVEELDADRCRLTLGSWSWVSLAAAFARYDADLADVTPTELRDAFAELGDRLHRAASSVTR